MSIESGAWKPPEATAEEKKRTAERAAELGSRFNASSGADSESAKKRAAEFADRKQEVAKKDEKGLDSVQTYVDTYVCIKDVQSAYKTADVDGPQMKKDMADWFQEAVDRAKDLKSPGFDRDLQNDTGMASDFAPLLSILGPKFASAVHVEAQGFSDEDPKDKANRARDKNAFLQTAKKLFPDVQDDVSKSPQQSLDIIVRQFGGNELIADVGAWTKISPARDTEQLKQNVNQLISELGRRVGDFRQFKVDGERDDIVENTDPRDIKKKMEQQ